MAPKTVRFLKGTAKPRPDIGVYPTLVKNCYCRKSATKNFISNDRDTSSLIVPGPIHVQTSGWPPFLLCHLQELQRQCRKRRVQSTKATPPHWSARSTRTSIQPQTSPNTLVVFGSLQTLIVSPLVSNKIPTLQKLRFNIPKRCCLSHAPSLGLRPLPASTSPLSSLCPFPLQSHSRKCRAQRPRPQVAPLKKIVRLSNDFRLPPTEGRRFCCDSLESDCLIRAFHKRHLFFSTGKLQ
jgi:hypothetical protein